MRNLKRARYTSTSRFKRTKALERRKAETYDRDGLKSLLHNSGSRSKALFERSIPL